MKADQLAINSITTRQSSLDEALDAYAAAGFRNIEFHLPLAKDAGVDQVRLKLAKHGLTSIGGFDVALSCFGEPNERERSLAALLDNARFLHELGGGVLVFGTDGPNEPSLDALETVAEALVTTVDGIAELNVVLALEFNWGPLVRSLESAIRVVGQVNHPRIGVLFDPAHYRTTVTKLEQLTPQNVRWIKHVHFNDMNGTPGEFANCNTDRVLPGEGVLGLKRIITALEAGGYRGFFSVELFSEELWSLPAAEAAARCYASCLNFCEASAPAAHG